jgi:hypothetical protein
LVAQLLIFIVHTMLMCIWNFIKFLYSEESKLFSKSFPNAVELEKMSSKLTVWLYILYETGYTFLYFQLVVLFRKSRSLRVFILSDFALFCQSDSVNLIKWQVFVRNHLDIFMDLPHQIMPNPGVINSAQTYIDNKPWIFYPQNQCDLCRCDVVFPCMYNLVSIRLILFFIDRFSVSILIIIFYTFLYIFFIFTELMNGLCNWND